MFGLLIVVLGGLIHGSFALPMKKLERKWAWENIWLVYSVAGLIILPPLLAFFTVPGLVEIYQQASGRTLFLVALFGLGWGTGSVLFGQAISRIGMALGFAVILGITSSVGSLIPLVIFDPAAVWTPKGKTLLLSIAIAVVGIVFCSLAGAQRDRDSHKATGAPPKSKFVSGLLVSILSGFLSPMLNIGFVFGQPLQAAGAAHGAGASFAANTVWAPALFGGFLANAGYAIYLLYRNRTWSRYQTAKAGPGAWLGASLMGLLWFGGISIYGMGTASLGTLGAVVGWPAFMSTVIITANILGFLA
ncbi:MAG: rhamnose/proton symporter RhaT, partial [Acidobacteria bacterium]|nr:rhamnose/proton symporter RhaT [Acidobacteriota bacterium]